ncbi:MAG: Type 1 glutamine amidotransferase-like domain-containing protein [Patescibacteria group bacterium]
MKKLLLTSDGFTNTKIAEEFLKLVSKPSADIKVLFIPTAAVTEHEKFYANKCKEELLQAGVRSENLIIYNLDRSLSPEEKGIVDVVYFTGGNTFYLIHRLRESGFDQVVKDLVQQGKVYVGVSASTVTAGPNISIAGPWDPNDVGMTEFAGLNLTHVIIAPHYTNEEREIIDKFEQESGLKVLRISDNQAFMQIDENISIIE